MNPGGKPQISRELLARMTGGSINSSGIGDDGALGAGPSISTHRVEQRGRKHIGAYRQSVIGRRQAVSGAGAEPSTQHAGQKTSSSTPKPGRQSFQGPQSRGYNPYG